MCLAFDLIASHMLLTFARSAFSPWSSPGMSMMRSWWPTVIRLLEVRTTLALRVVADSLALVANIYSSGFIGMLG